MPLSYLDGEELITLNNFLTKITIIESTKKIQNTQTRQPIRSYVNSMDLTAMIPLGPLASGMVLTNTAMSMFDEYFGQCARKDMMIRSDTYILMPDNANVNPKLPADDVTVLRDLWLYMNKYQTTKTPAYSTVINWAMRFLKHGVEMTDLVHDYALKITGTESTHDYIFYNLSTYNYSVDLFEYWKTTFRSTQRMQDAKVFLAANADAMNAIRLLAVGYLVGVASKVNCLMIGGKYVSTTSDLALSVPTHNQIMGKYNFMPSVELSYRRFFAHCFIANLCE